MTDTHASDAKYEVYLSIHDTNNTNYRTNILNILLLGDFYQFHFLCVINVMMNTFKPSVFTQYNTQKMYNKHDFIIFYTNKGLFSEKLV